MIMPKNYLIFKKELKKALFYIFMHNLNKKIVDESLIIS